MLTHTIAFPPSLEQIGNEAFLECSSIQGAIVPDCSHLTLIGGSAFYGCSELERFEIAEGGKAIDFGSESFHNCHTLEFFSCHCISIFDDSFNDDHNLETVVFHGSPSKSSPAVQYLSTLKYSGTPVFQVPRGCSIDDLTVATLQFYDPSPRPCTITAQRLVNNIRVLVDKKLFCPSFTFLIGRGAPIL